ncbi:hypothetical protein ESCO_006743 [Escovopsis weberi]|uniref:Uncharacterized protein n=1 Tax=Escovopsis weberi TaxID=150374 RepID=A0A0M8N757_ESCWE|nr:hypothetical protein ESCO_006743 [Escovopsis weberi]
MGSLDTSGTLLADIANLVSEGLRTLSASDQRRWGEDEHDQVRALEALLDEAKKDFQEFCPLVNGRSQELRALRAKFHAHVQNLKDWDRFGGAIEPTWVRETYTLKRELHRAQCRIAMRVFTSSHEVSQRCLGAFLVHRIQRAGGTADGGQAYEQRCQEELRTCKSVGTFQRFGEHDIAFVCDFCDGHLVWTDLEHMPSLRTVQGESTLPPTASATLLPSSSNWQATGIAHAGEGEGEDEDREADPDLNQDLDRDREERQKQIIFAPVAIANHTAPPYGDWQARLLCPLCEEAGGRSRDGDGEEEESWGPDDDLFDDLESLQEHLEWQHGAGTTLPLAFPGLLSSTDKCVVM